MKTKSNTDTNFQIDITKNEVKLLKSFIELQLFNLEGIVEEGSNPILKKEYDTLKAVQSKFVRLK